MLFRKEVFRIFLKHKMFIIFRKLIRILIRSSCSCGSSYCSNHFFNWQNVLKLLKNVSWIFLSDPVVVLVAVIGAIRRQTTKNKAAAADQPNCFISFPIFTAIFISFLIFHHVFFFLFAWISMQLLIFDDIFMSFLRFDDRPNCSISFPIFTAIFIVFSEYLLFFIWVFSRCWLWWILLFLLLNFLALGKIFSGFGFATEAMALGRC